MKYTPGTTTYTLSKVDYSIVPWYRRILIILINSYQPFRFILTGKADHYKVEIKYLKYDGTNLTITPNAEDQ